MNAPPMQYLALHRVKLWRQTEIPRGTRGRADGYGSKIPGPFQLKIGARWHRVYTVCWSNAGTDYVMVGGQPIYLETGWHHELRIKLGPAW